jgi:hypothetical protein
MRLPGEVQTGEIVPGVTIAVLRRAVQQAVRRV